MFRLIMALVLPFIFKVDVKRDRVIVKDRGHYCCIKTVCYERRGDQHIAVRTHRHVLKIVGPEWDSREVSNPTEASEQPASVAPPAPVPMPAP